MKHILEFFSQWAERTEQRKRERQEAYLAKSIDLIDLETRMRELDRAHLGRPQWLHQQPL